MVQILKFLKVKSAMEFGNILLVLQTILEMGNNGNVIILWGQSDGAFEQVFMSEYR